MWPQHSGFMALQTEAGIISWASNWGFALCKSFLCYSEKRIKEEGEMSLDEWGDTVNTALYPLAQTRGEILSFCQQYYAS